MTSSFTDHALPPPPSLLFPKPSLSFRIGLFFSPIASCRKNWTRDVASHFELRSTSIEVTPWVERKGKGTRIPCSRRNIRLPPSIPRINGHEEILNLEIMRSPRLQPCCNRAFDMRCISCSTRENLRVFARTSRRRGGEGNKRKGKEGKIGEFRLEKKGRIFTSIEFGAALPSLFLTVEI